MDRRASGRQPPLPHRGRSKTVRSGSPPDIELPFPTPAITERSDREVKGLTPSPAGAVNAKGRPGEWQKVAWTKNEQAKRGRKARFEARDPACGRGPRPEIPLGFCQSAGLS